jgi:predicted glycogen debranching enzyme
MLLKMAALVNHRDHHGNTHVQDRPPDLTVERVPGGLRIDGGPGRTPFYLLGQGASATPQPRWYDSFFLRVEDCVGLDPLDHNLRAGWFQGTLEPGESLTIVASVADADGQPRREGVSAYQTRRAAERRLLEQAEPLLKTGPLTIEHLVLAADQFVVDRTLPDGSAGKSVIAGYPWFSDWGRDTMISLPGLTLATGRIDVAARILDTFASYASRGMLPNRFPDEGEAPEYNTVDATLWYFEAIRAYYRASGDEDRLRQLFPVLREILDWHVRGTRYQIHADPADGLLYAGEPGVQLTWMDAKVDDWVVTPREGKAVEINALWYNALRTAAGFARILGEPPGRYETLAEKARTGFARFWNEELGYCYDVLDGPGGHDPALRPNQLLAVSLPHSPLLPEQQKAVVDVCARRLLTSHGLRSLAADDPAYTGRHGGSRHARDAAYHQGTVWGWLIGPFASAHLRVYRSPVAARSFLEPLLRHLAGGCVGSLSEIFDGDPPHTPRGCFAQAWTVAEVLRVWEETAQSGG